MGSVTSIFKASSDGTVKDVLHGAPSGTWPGPSIPSLANPST